MKSHIKNITRVVTLGLTTSIATICMSNQAEAATIDTTSISVSINPDTGQKGSAIPNDGYYQSSYTLKKFTVGLNGLIEGNPTRLGSNQYLPSGSSYNLTLDSLTFSGAQSYGNRHLVITDSSGLILGYSTNYTMDNQATTFTFIGTDGNALTVSTDDTLSFVPVHKDQMSGIKDGTIQNIEKVTTSNLQFGAGSQGIVDYGSGSGSHNDKNTTYLSNNYGNTEYRYGVASDIKFTLQIPEPTTTTLSLLGLGALLLRRRRTALIAIF